jgi:hypothetical protein
MYGYVMNDFLSSESFEIRMEAIKTVAFILRCDIETRMELRAEQILSDQQGKFFSDLMETHSIKPGREANTSDVGIDDDVINEIAGYSQLFSALFCANFLFRKPIILELAKLVMLFRLDEKVPQRIFRKILKTLNSDAASIMDLNSMESFLSEWFYNSYRIER